MSFSPHGASALVTGSLRKGLPIMVLGGVLAWISGQSWSLGRGATELFPMGMACATLVVVAIPAQLVAGRRGHAWMMATAAALGATVPWFFSLAVRQQGQDVLAPTLVVLVVSWVLVLLTCRLTRRLAWPRVRRAP